MPSTASDLLKLELQATGENASTWGVKANTLFERMEESIAETLSISLASLGGAGYVLDDTQYVKNSGATGESHVAALKFTGTLTGNEEVQVPARNKTYWVWNATSGAFTVTMNISGGAGIVVPQGTLMAVIADGTNVEALTPPVTTAGVLDSAAYSSSAAIRTALGLAIGTDVQAYDAGISTTPLTQGVHTIAVPATAMYAATTNGAASGSSETTTNAVMITTWDFDAATDEFVQFQVPMPTSWDEGTITAQFYWSHAATATNFDVVWGIQGLSLSDGDAIDAAFGTAQTVTDTGGTTDDLYATAATSAVTISGTPAAGDVVIFRVYRDANAGGDTLAVDARLHAVKIAYTLNAGNDA